MANRRQELKIFIYERNLDIALICETHFIKKSYLKIPIFSVYDTKHPDGSAHGGTAIIIKTSIKHYELPKFDKEHIQATSVVVLDWRGPITFSAIYSPPKHTVKKERFL